MVVMRNLHTIFWTAEDIKKKVAKGRQLHSVSHTMIGALREMLEPEGYKVEIVSYTVIRVCYVPEE